MQQLDDKIKEKEQNNNSRKEKRKEAIRNVTYNSGGLLLINWMTMCGGIWNVVCASLNVYIG